MIKLEILTFALVVIGVLISLIHLIYNIWKDIDQKKLRSKTHIWIATLKQNTEWKNGFSHTAHNKTYMVGVPVAVTEKEKRELELQHPNCFSFEKNPGPFTAY